MKKIIMLLVFGLVAAVFVTTGSASAAQDDTETEDIGTTMNKLILEMQQEMISKNFTARLLKNPMRTKMMAELVPRRFMQNSIQPVIMEQVRAIFKAQQMEVLMIR